MATSQPAENIYEQNLVANKANFTPLSPLSFIARASKVYPNSIAVIHENRRYTWAKTYERSRCLASALKARGVGIGDAGRV